MLDFPTVTATCILNAGNWYRANFSKLMSVYSITVCSYQQLCIVWTTMLIVTVTVSIMERGWIYIFFALKYCREHFSERFQDSQSASIPDPCLFQVNCLTTIKYHLFSVFATSGSHLHLCHSQLIFLVTMISHMVSPYSIMTSIIHFIALERIYLTFWIWHVTYRF